MLIILAIFSNYFLIIIVVYAVYNYFMHVLLSTSVLVQIKNQFYYHNIIVRLVAGLGEGLYYLLLA